MQHTWELTKVLSGMFLYIIINLIYVEQFDTNGILTALCIVIKYTQMQYMHICTYIKRSCSYTYTCLHICAYIDTRTNIHKHINKWRWAGHIERMKDNRWTERCTEWQPRREKISRGRPSRRWQDDRTRKGGTTWNRKATDRGQWKTLIEGYTLQRMDTA